MSLRQREYVLESLEQRVLLSADGVIPTVSMQRGLPGYSPADIILMDEHNGATQPASHDSAADNLVDTTAPVANETETSDVAPATTETTNETPTATSVTVPSDPDVPSAADLLVSTLHAGNGPPASGNNYSVGTSSTATDYDPPFGGFNFTPVLVTGSDPAAEQAALLSLFSTGTGGTVTMHGTMVKRPDAGTTTDYAQGLLSLTGTFKFARHLDTADGTTPALDSAGNFVFDVWFDTALTSGSLTLGGVTLNFGADKGAFLVSGKLTPATATAALAAPVTDNTLATYPDADVGGAAGTISLTSLLGLAGTDEAISLGTLTGGTITFNTATGLANATKAGMTAATNIRATGLGATFVGANSVTMAGSVSITLGGAVAIGLSGNLSFSITDTNGAATGGQVMTISVTGGEVAFTAGTVTMTATVSGSFTIGAAGFVATGTVSGLTTTIVGINFGNTSGTFSLDTTGTTAAISVSATLDLTVTTTGVSAGLHGTFTFDRSTLGTEDVIRIALSGGSTSLAAGTASLGINGINGSFVINSHGFAGKASVAGVTLTPAIAGFTFTPSSLFFEINTTGDEINNLVIPGGQTLNFMGNDRKKFFRIQGGLVLGLDLGGIAVSLDGTFYFEKYSLSGTDVIKFAAINANASFAAGGIGLGVTTVNGGFVIDNSGIAGFVTAAAITTSGMPAAITALSGSNLSFSINTTGHAVVASFGIADSAQTVSFDYSDANELSFVSVGGTIHLGVSAGGASVGIDGAIAFYGGTVDGNEVIKIGGEGLNASVTVGPVTAAITDVDFIFVLVDAGANSGVAGRITFQDLTFTGISNFTLSASGFSFEFNTTGLEIDEALDVGAVHQVLKFTAVDNELDFFRGSGTATLAFTSGAFSTTMSGTFGFEKLVMTTGGATVVKFAFTNVNFEIGVGTAKLKILDASGFFVFGNNSGGVASYAGTLKVTDAKLENVTGLDLQVTNFTFDVNTFGEAVTTNIGTAFTLDFSASTKWSFISLGGVVDLTITLGSFSVKLTGGFYFEKSTETINGVAQATLKISVSDAGFKLNIGGTDMLTATGINGAFLVNANGTSAGKLTITSFTLAISGLSLTGGSIGLEYNNTGGAVAATIPTAGGGSVALNYTTDVLRVGGTINLTLAISGFNAVLDGTFFFEKTTDSILVAFKDVHFLMQVGSIKVEINKLNGVYMGFADNSVVASFTVGTTAGAPAASVTGVTGLTFTIQNFLFEINTTNADVTNKVVTFADSSTLTFSVAHNVLRVGGQIDVAMALGGFTAQLDGQFFFEKTADSMQVSFKDVHLLVQVGTIKVEVNKLNGVYISYTTGGVVASFTVGTTAGAPAVDISGVTGLVFTVQNFLFEINTTNADVTKTVTFASGDSLTFTVAHNVLRLGGQISVAMELGAFKAALDGQFFFEKTSDSMLVAFKDVHLLVQVGTIKVEVNKLNGVYISYITGGVVASFTVGTTAGAPAVSITGVTGLEFTVQNFLFEINTTNADVTKTVTFASGDSLTFTVAHNVLRLGGQIAVAMELGAFKAALDGQFFFEKTADSMLVAFKDVHLLVQVGTIKVEVNKLNGVYISYTTGGVVASFTVGTTAGAPAVDISGITGLTFTVQNFLFEINTTNADVTKTVTFASGDSLTFTVAHNVLRLGGQIAVIMSLGGFTAALDGQFFFEKTADSMLVAFKDVHLLIQVGTIKVEVNKLNGVYISYTTGGVVASFTVGTTAGAPAVDISGVTGLVFTVQNFLFEINTTNADVTKTVTFASGDSLTFTVAHNVLRVGGQINVAMSLGGFTAQLDGQFFFEKTADSMLVAFKDVHLLIAVGASVSLEVNKLNGVYISYTSGAVVASFTVGNGADGKPAVSLNGAPGMVLDVTTFLFEINTTNADVTKTVTFASGDSLTFTVEHDTLRIGGGIDLTITIGSFTGKLRADFFFQKQTIGTVDVIKVSVTNGSLLLSVGASISISGVNGAFVILPTGTAGKLSIATIALTGAPAFTLEVLDLYMEFNNTGADLTMSVPVQGGSPIALNFVNASGQPDRHNFFLISGSIRIKIGGTPAAPYLTIETLDLKVDTGATGDQHLFEAGLLRGTLNIAALGGSITVEAGNLAITADGKLANLVDDPDYIDETHNGPLLGSVFYVRVTFGVANNGERPAAGSFQWPSWMPIKVEQITLAWADIANHSDQFILVISATLGPIPGLTTVNFTGMVKNLRIDVYKLTHPGNGFPVLGFDAAAIEISGNLFGMQITGGVVMGMIDFRADGTIIDRSNVANLTELADGTIFYFGLRAHVTIGNIGAGFSIGMADIDPTANTNLVPLEAMISVEAPVIIEPISGLTLGAFTARIQFASTLEYSRYGPDPLHPENGAHSYAEIDELKAVTIATATNPTLSQWEAGLRVSTLALYRSASPTGAVDVWSKPMVITAAVTMYSSYVSREALNGTLMLKFDTQGRMILVGELLMGGGNMKLDAKMYANFSNVSGGFEFTFYGSMGPTAVNPRPFQIWGALSIKIYDRSHNLLGSPANAQAIDYEAANPGTPALASQAGYLEIAFTGGVQFSVGTAIIAKAEGTLKLEVDFHVTGTTVTTLTFNATLSLVNPNPNPLGANFAEITGTVVLKVGAGNSVELYGALLLHFNGNALRAYGIDVNSADIFLQINTTGSEKTVTLDFASAPDIDVTIRATSFSLYIKGDIGFGTPPANASDPNSVTHLIELKGFLILEIDASGMTLAVYADITLAPGGTEVMKFNVTGFLRIQYDGVHDGVAAKLKLVRTGGATLPGMDFSGSSTFFLMFNTTGAEVTYTIPDWFYGPTDPHLPDIVIPESAPAFGGDLSVPADATAPPETYFVIYVDGSLTAMGGTFTLKGEFFVVITPTEFLLQVDADLEIGPSGSPFITFSATGFMKITAAGIAARLDLGLSVTMPSQLSFSAGFQLILNTTGQIQTYQAKDSAGVLQTYTIAQAAPEIGGNLQVAADIDTNPATTTPGSPYFLLAMHGNLTALSSFTLSGDFFIVITTGKVQLQVNAALTLAGISLTAHGFLEVASEGAAGLLEISTSLNLPGITIVNAKFFVAFNTFSTDYVLPASVIAQFHLTNDQTKLDHGLIRIQVSGTVRIGSVFELDGFFFFEHTTTHDILTVQAKASLPIIGDLQVSGTLIITSAGAVGSLTITITTGNRSALSAIGLTFNATMSLKVNTTSVAVDDPDNVDATAMIDADTVQIDLSGSLTLMNIFTFEGDFFFKKSGTDLNIRFKANLNIDVIGKFTVTGAFNSTSAGFTGELAMSFVPGSAVTGFGFSISGTFLMAVNTTNSTYTPTVVVAGDNGGVLEAHSLRIMVTGSVSFFGALTISGTFSLKKTPSTFEVYVNAQLSLAGIMNLDVVGWLGIYSDGIAAKLTLGAKPFDFAPVFTASGTFTFEINTSLSQSHLGIKANYLKVSVDNLSLKLIGIFEFTGHFYFEYDAGAWTVHFDASTSFLGLATATASGTFRSDGYYSIDVGGTISIGVSGFGIFGGFSFHIDGIFGSVKHISGNVNGHAELFGLSFGLSASFGWSDSDPNGDVWVHAEIEIDFFFFSITFGATFVVAHITGTSTYQAGLQNNPRVWDDGATGGVLYVNVGDVRAAQRNFKIGDTNEQVVISQGAAGIIIDVLGQKNLYKGVTKVIVNTGSGSDYVMVDSTVTVPVEINLGDGDDFADINSNGNVTIWGGAGRDTINGGPGADTIYGEGDNDMIKGGGGDDIISGGDGDDIITGGTGNDTLTGDAGNDSFLWTIGDGVDKVINGGTGINSLSLDFDNSANGVTVTGVGNDFAVNYGSTTLTGLIGLTNANQLTNISSLFMNLRGGADKVSIGYFGGASNLDSLGLALGDGDNAADTVIFAGSGSNDIYRVTSTLVSHSIQIGTDYGTTPAQAQNPTKIFYTYNTTSLLVSGVNSLDLAPSFFNLQIEQGGGSADQLVINAGNGDDVVDAHNVVNTAVTLTLNGEAGNDRLVGSSFADFINGGTGSDTLTGGPGADTFTDSSVNPGPTDNAALFDLDEIVETQNVDFTLNGWTLTAGGVQDALIPSVFESIRLNGGTGNNTFTVSNVATTVTLNGGDGSDNYLITIAGSGISLINIFDDGAGGAANTDMLKVYGTSGADNFQLRDGVISAGNVANVHVETIKFTGLNAFEIWAGAGNDNFIVDETLVGGTIYGEGGADSFLVGRIVTPVPSPSDMRTIATTRGALAYGNRALLTINGGDGDDYFEVNHNQAELRLNGDDGDDTFFLKTYLKEGSALSNVTGGTGSNTIQYVANGPVKINGGAGFDKLVLEGTEADDVFIVTDTDIFGGGRSISFTNIESIQILGGPGNDTVWVLGNGLPLEINGGSGDDIVNIGGQAPDYVYDAPEVVVDDPPYTVSTPIYWGGFTFTFTQAAHFEFNGSFPFFHWVPDVTYSISIPRILIGYTTTTIDPDPVTYDPAPVTYRFANVTNFNGVTNGVEVYNWAGPRDETKTVDNDPNNPLRNPGATPNSRRNLGTINAPVKVIGGTDNRAGENDVLNINIAGTTTDLTARLISTIEHRLDPGNINVIKGPVGQLLGLGLPDTFTAEGRTFMGGILFDSLESLVLNLGSGNDSLTIGTNASDRATVAGYPPDANTAPFTDADYDNGTFGAVDVTVNGNGGNDTVNLRANTGTVTFNGAAGTDVFNLGSNASNASNTAGNLDALVGGIVFDGGAGADSLNLDDRGDTTDNVLTLTQTTAAGMGMGAGITSYTGLESLLVGFGSGADIANVQGTAAGTVTTLQLNDGDDSIYVSSAAAVTTANRATTTTLGGHLDDVDGNLFIQGGNGRQRLMVSDRDTASANGTSGTPAVITNNTLTGFSTGVINYSASVTGDYGNGITVWTGSGADFVNVNSIFLRAGLRNSTSLNTGAGVDTINVNLPNSPNAFFAVHAGGGNDVINATLGTLGLLIFGGDGDDSITTGVGNHLIFGDEGSASYLDGSGLVVARYGSGGVDDFTDAVIRDLSSATTVISTGGNDTITTGSGNDYIFGGAGGDTINAGEGDNVVAGDHANILLTDGLVTRFTSRLWSGGNDSITTGAGRDIIIGGTGDDSINAGAGFNFILGDHGGIVLVTNIVSSLSTVDSADGGVDTITTLGGRDFILGGEAGDVINAGEGDNVVAGDSGSLIILSASAFTFNAGVAANGGNDTITTGAGADTIIGGDGADTIIAGNGSNVVFGDHGTISRDLALGAFTVTSYAEGTGDNDTITTGTGTDVIFGGAATDTIVSGAGNDFVFGDSGTITFDAGLPVTAGTTAPNTGAADNIQSGDGADVVLGGDGADTINAGNGQNLVFGDYGTINWTGADLLNATATAAGTGGVDDITTGIDDDIIFGGNAGDTVHSGAGADVIFGDQGRVDFTGGLATSLNNLSATGDGSDSIFGEAGNDVILGGGLGDTISAGEGDNSVLGDHGAVIRGVNGSTLTTITISIADSNVGGNDTITAGSGNDWIVGGTGADTINAGEGVNAVIGDEGSIITTGFILTQLVTTTTFGGNDTITVGSGANFIIGGAGTDTITVAGGVSVVFGDHGQLFVNGTTLISAETLNADTGARDIIVAGNGSHWIFGGDANDSITVGNGFAAVFGDHGRIDLTSGGTLTLVSNTFGSGGNDTITTGSGDDIIFGGLGSDVINAGEGNNVVFGDHGEVIKTSAGLDWVTTLAPTQGAGDTITTGAGNDVIFGGAGNDTIHAGAGRNLIFGDHGSVDFTANDPRTITSSDYTIGGDDTIDSGLGDDLILGGFGADHIDADDGDNVIFGDQGTVEINSGVLIDVYTEQPAVGSQDFIVSGFGNDVILGGAAADTIDAGDGDNVIIGDHAELHWIVGILARAISTNFGAGAADDITSGLGDDVIIAGPDDDTIDTGDGDNIVFGDNGSVYWTTGVIVQATTEDSVDVGANDTIVTGAGSDLVFGGAGADNIHAGAGADFIFGDNGDALFGGGLLSSLQTLTPAYSANDSISGESGDDVILGGQGADSISGGEDNDIILGDEGLVILNSSVVQSVTSESFADGMADTINGDNGNDFIIGGNGADTINGGEGNNVIAGDNALFTLPGHVLTQVEVVTPDIGAVDTITTGAGNDVIMGGAAGDIIIGGNGDNVVIGDHGTITFLGGVFATFTPTTPEIGGNDTITTGSGADRIVGGTGADWINAGDGNNVVVGDHAIIIQNNGALTSVQSVAFADGGIDLIFTGSGNDLVIGGTAGDTIHAGAGNDLVFGDHALVSGNINLALLPLAMAVHPFTFISISTQNAGPDGRSVAGDDVIFGDAGDDILLGQQGNDILFGGDGDDDLTGGHNVGLGQDGADVLDGGAGYDVLAGDNASILRRGDNISPRAHVLAGDAMFDDRGNLLDLDTPQAWPTAVPERDTIIFDHAFNTDASLFGNDQLVGGAGDDVIFGELGDDQIHGDATLPVDVAADGTIDRTALRATATALFTTNFWVGADSDGDDYIEGNGGNDLIFGGLGQDDIVGGSSALFGLLDSEHRPDGGDTIYGGNGTQADDQSDSDFGINGRSRDADVIMGDNANIIRLVGLNGVSSGGFLTFSYAPGAGQIIVRGFDLLDYTIPESAADIGAADTIYGEQGDDTLHGQVGDDLMYGNGNDDNLYGGQGDDKLFGGAGDDSISPSDELKAPPPAAGSGGAAEGSGADGTAGGTIILTLPGNLAAILIIDPNTGAVTYVAPRIVITSVGNGGDRIGQDKPTGYSDYQSSWRLFSSGIISSGRDFSPNTPSFFNEPAGAEKEEDKPLVDDPTTPQDESKPAAPTQEGQTAPDGQPAPVDGEAAPAEEQAAPADTKPAEGENPPPAEGDNAGTPPANNTTPPAPDAGATPPPPVPPTT